MATGKTAVDGCGQVRFDAPAGEPTLFKRGGFRRTRTGHNEFLDTFGAFSQKLNRFECSWCRGSLSFHSKTCPQLAPKPPKIPKMKDFDDFRFTSIHIFGTLGSGLGPAVVKYAANHAILLLKKMFRNKESRQVQWRLVHTGVSKCFAKSLFFMKMFKKQTCFSSKTIKK